jgi:hypothetical protein
MRRLALALLFGPVLLAAEDRLAAIHALLVPMRTAPIADSRGATPALTNVKHQLRDWIEFHVAALQWKDTGWTTNPTVLQEQLNDELSRAGLFCPHDATCSQNELGYLDRAVLDIQFGFLVVRTSVGLQVCGTDDSAYIYQSTDNHWHEIWHSEQDNYEEKTYFPQRLVDVRISPANWNKRSDRSEHLIITTGVFPWCTSVWQPVYYRVWQTKSTYSKPLLLLDGSEQAFIEDPIHAGVNNSDVYIKYDVGADDGMRVPELRHYILENGKLRRTDPVALTPQAFVSFWLRHPWSEVLEWTSPTGRASLKSWRRHYNGNNSEFTPPTRHCTLHPDLWQVATNPSIDPQPVAHYFLIRARPPFRFSMVAASDHPWPDCTEDDDAIDQAPDLFER